MNHADPAEPSSPGRRALPVEAHDGEFAAPQRSAGPDDNAALFGPRRAASAETADSAAGTAPAPQQRQRWLLAVPAVILVAGVLLWLVLRQGQGVSVVEMPSVPPTNPPSVTDATTSASKTRASTSPSSKPGASTAPLPGTVSPTAAPSEPAEPSPDGSIPAGTMKINDATFTAPPGWILYGDDLIEGDRRAVRLSQESTDARLQAVTLIAGDSDLASSCRSLVDLQQSQFSDVTRGLVVPIGVEATSSNGVRCGFHGVRSSDGVANTVAFTLVSRSTDSHVLMLRTTIPDEVASGSPTVAQLAAMSCQASSSFGVPLPLC